MLFEDSISILSFKISPALLTCLFYGFFASLVVPFAGFLASGLKRANSLKDFSNIFPGHGGFLDRFDCWIFATIFMFGVLTLGLYKEDILMNEILHNFSLLCEVD